MQQRAQSLAARLGTAFPRLEGGDGCVVAAPTPGQPNSFDCGVFAIKFAQCCALDQDLSKHPFGQQHIDTLRRRAVIEMMNLQLAVCKLDVFGLPRS